MAKELDSLSPDLEGGSSEPTLSLDAESLKWLGLNEAVPEERQAHWLRPRKFQRDFIESTVAAARAGRRQMFAGVPAGAGKTLMMARSWEAIAPLLERQSEYVVVDPKTGEHVVEHKHATAWLSTTKTIKEQHYQSLMACDTRLFSELQILCIEGDDPTVILGQIELARLIKPKWVVMHHEILRLYINQLLEAVDSDVDAFFLDEADIMGNNSSGVSFCAQALATKAAYRGVFTATPIRNKPDSLYPLLKIIEPAEVETAARTLGTQRVKLPHPFASATFGTRAEFENRYLVKDEYGTVKGGKNKPELFRRLKALGVFTLTRTEFYQAAEIYVLDTEIVYLDMDEDQRKVYEECRQGVIRWIDANADEFEHGDREERGMILKRLLVQISYLRSACQLPPLAFAENARKNQNQSVRQMAKEHGIQLDEEALGKLEIDIDLDVVARDAKAHPTSKMRWIRDHLRKQIQELDPYADHDEGEYGGTLVYSERTYLHAIMKGALAKEFETLGYGQIDGTVNLAGKEAARVGVKKGTTRVVQIGDGGGRGLNLQNLNWVIIFHPTWTVTQIDQAVGRVTRWGQQRVVHPVLLIYNNTLEAKWMLPMLDKKQHDVNEIMTGGKGRTDFSGPFSGITDLVSVKNLL